MLEAVRLADGSLFFRCNGNKQWTLIFCRPIVAQFSTAINVCDSVRICAAQKAKKLAEALFKRLCEL